MPTPAPDFIPPDEALDLILKGQFPAGAAVDGDLAISRAVGLRWLPDALIVEGALDIRDCPDLEDLPEGLKAATVRVRRCPALASIGAMSYPDDMDAPEPDVISLTGNLIIEHCPQLKHVPRALYVDGFVRIMDCAVLEDADAPLLRTIRTGGDAVIGGCPRVKALARDIKVGGTLSVANCEALTRLYPIGGKCRAEQGLTVWSSPKLKALPPVQYGAQATLSVESCAGLARIEGADLPAGCQYRIVACPKLTSLPANIKLPNKPGGVSEGAARAPVPKPRFRGCSP